MAEKHELEIVIEKNGRVKVETLGVKGKKCLEYVKLFEKLLGGRVVEQRLKSEYYEPESRLGIDVQIKK